MDKHEYVCPCQLQGIQKGQTRCEQNQRVLGKGCVSRSSRCLGRQRGRVIWWWLQIQQCWRKGDCHCHELGSVWTQKLPVFKFDTFSMGWTLHPFWFVFSQIWRRMILLPKPNVHKIRFGPVPVSTVYPSVLSGSPWLQPPTHLGSDLLEFEGILMNIKRMKSSPIFSMLYPKMFWEYLPPIFLMDCMHRYLAQDFTLQKTSTVNHCLLQNRNFQGNPLQACVLLENF